MTEKAKRRGLMLVLSSPSGAGKTTLSRALLEQNPKTVLSISTTTRPKRPGEVDGKDYNFVDQATFQKLVDEEAFLEYATVFDHAYGTPKKDVEEALIEGKDVLFDIDWQGTQQILQKNSSDVVSIFILPPTISALRERLISRGQDTKQQIEKRMKTAHGELSHWPEYNYVLVNEDFNECLKEIKTILKVERKKRIRQKWLVNFVKNLMSQEI